MPIWHAARLRAAKLPAKVPAVDVRFSSSSRVRILVDPSEVAARAVRGRAPVAKLVVDGLGMSWERPRCRVCGEASLSLVLDGPPTRVPNGGTLGDDFRAWLGRRVRR